MKKENRVPSAYEEYAAGKHAAKTAESITEIAPGTISAETGENTAAAGKKKKTGLWVTGIVVGVLILAYAGLCALAEYTDTIFRNTDVLGVDMSELTFQQAKELWEEKGEDVCKNTVIPLQMSEGELNNVTLSELGVSISPEDAAAAAWNAGHGSNFIVNGYQYARSWVAEHSLVPQMTVDEKALQAKTDDISNEWNCTVVDGGYVLDRDGALGAGLYITKPADGTKINAEKLLADLRADLEGRVLAPVTCEYQQVVAKTVDIAQLHEQLQDTMVSSIYDRETGTATQDHTGVEFDVDTVQAQFDAAAEGETFLAEATVEFPAVTQAELEECMFRDVLGTYTTHVSGTSVRKGNVRRAAELINGKIYNPGEEFWYNGTIGKRTVERGFGAAPAYVAGKTVNEVGGGICQTSSTLYYATLLANLKIVLRYCHQFAPGYITFGCDATVSWGGPDFAFSNNTDYPIKIVTSYDSDNLTVSILGTKTDENYVKMESYTRSSTGYSVVYEENPDLEYGAEVEVQTPYTGYYVETYRCIYDKDDNLISRTFEAKSDYESRNRIIQVATGDSRLFAAYAADAGLDW